MISPFCNGIVVFTTCSNMYVSFTGTIYFSISLVTESLFISLSCDWQEQQFTVWSKYNASHLSVSDPFQTHCYSHSLVTSFPLYSLGMTVLFSPLSLTHFIPAFPHCFYVSKQKKKSKLSSISTFFLHRYVDILSPDILPCFLRLSFTHRSLSYTV